MNTPHEWYRRTNSYSDPSSMNGVSRDIMHNKIAQIQTEAYDEGYKTGTNKAYVRSCYGVVILLIVLTVMISLIGCAGNKVQKMPQAHYTKIVGSDGYILISGHMHEALIRMPVKQSQTIGDTLVITIK